jgi:endonuclease YncB( thermonuclease family)
MQSAPALVVVLLFLPANGMTADQVANRVGLRFDAQVVRVGDGDSVELIPVGETKPLTVRLEGIDAPELAEPFGREARSFARTLLLKQHVHVHGRDTDRYGRLVARVSVGTRDASLELLRAGLACYFTRYATDPLLAEAQARARASAIGFWAANAQKPQCATRSPQRRNRRRPDSKPPAIACDADRQAYSALRSHPLTDLTNSVQGRRCHGLAGGSDHGFPA